MTVIGIYNFYYTLPSAEDRMIKMMLVYRYLVKKVAVTFPPPTSLTSCGFNVHLAEDILCGIQARLCLYLMTPETGWHHDKYYEGALY